MTSCPLSSDDLRRTLERISGRGYKAYKDIEGRYQFPGFVLFVDHAQGDPFAAPSRVRVQVPAERAGFPGRLFSTAPRRTGLEDFLARRVALEIPRLTRGRRGSGKSGAISILPMGQEILPRTSLEVDPSGVEVRLSVGLPAYGRSVASREALAMFFEEIPALVEKALLYRSLDRDALEDRARLCDDQQAAREQLEAMGLVAFVANGSILPRRSGVSDEPMTGRGVVPFSSPPSLEVEMALPSRGPMLGMGVPKGVTLVIGGGYHGKSTLLRALERGVYLHIEGDGREFAISDPGAVKIRAEDGRRVEKVDISHFIDNLPFGQDTRAFSTENASGSTSQAANIQEALEVGATVLLLDEDTSATNFMIRDLRMQKLVPQDREPITPFIDRAREIFLEAGVSTVLVMGGSGDYLDIADTVIMMDAYRALDVTGKARMVAHQYPTGRETGARGTFRLPAPRIPVPGSFDPYRGRRVKIQPRGTRALVFGDTTVLLDDMEQLVDEGQTRAIGELIHHIAQNYVDGERRLRDILDEALDEVAKKGLTLLSPYHGQPEGTYAMPRIFELAGAVNRMRTLRVRQGGKEG